MDWLNSVLKEQYYFIRVMKSSEKGVVSQLRHKTLGKDIVKIEYKGNIEVYKVLQNISHENLPHIYNLLEKNGNCIVLEEFVDGITVAEILQSGLYNEMGVAKVVLSVCDALSVLHSFGIIHRDIKPENIMISNKGRVVLLDFDAARIYKTYQSQDTVFIGTAGFAAPEQFGISQTDERSDIFAVGILMNVMLTGEHPSKKLYVGKMRKIIEKCIQVDPNKRYCSATELKTAIKNIF